MDSLPPFALPPCHNTSVNLPDEAIISSAFKNRKRDRYMYKTIHNKHLIRGAGLYILYTCTCTVL